MTGSSERPRVYALNELSAFSFVWQAIRGGKPVFLAIEPILPPFHGLLHRLANWALSTGRARPVSALHPDLAPLEHYPTRVLLYDVFGQLEAWHNVYYRFDDVDRAVPSLSFAYRQISCNHVRWKHRTMLLIARILEQLPQARFVGLSTDSTAMARQYCGADLKSPAIPASMINSILGLALTAFAVVWTLSRLRLRIEPRSYFFAADYYADPRDHELYDNLSEGGPILLVPREPSCIVPSDVALGRDVYGTHDGYLTPSAAAGLLPEIIGTGFRIWRHFHRLEPVHFWALAALPWRRAVLRAFFCRFRPRYFWGRDDYNVEHIIRREEINKVGGLSYGLNHGYPAYSIIFPMWRYISFDRYFVFGRALYDRYMRKTWAQDMKIVPAGTFGATREQYAQRFRDRPKDIIVFAAVLVGDPQMVAFVRGLAAAFADRRVLLQVKSTFVDLPEGKVFIADCCADLPNVIHRRDNLFELFGQGRYSFSDPSTVVVEALQFGLYSFNIDISRIQRVSLLREYPDLCVESVEQAIARIQGIESDRWAYPWKSFEDLIDLSGRVFFDAVREDVGLPAREPARPISALSS